MISCLMKLNPEFTRMIAFHTKIQSSFHTVPNETQSRVYQNDSISYEMISCLMKLNPEFIRMIAFHTK